MVGSLPVTSKTSCVNKVTFPRNPKFRRRGLNFTISSNGTTLQSKRCLAYIYDWKTSGTGAGSKLFQTVLAGDVVLLLETYVWYQEHIIKVVSVHSSVGRYDKVIVL